ncbi:MAG TPA: hypothetical protein VGQ52_05160 [Gemmatimonadaceae bacterium]|jgi:hypothetical protein|nr:hypothetical protein [Gemmatimonadaceae bacterium]
MKLAHLVCLTSVITIGVTGCNKPRAAENRQVERTPIERNDQIAITTRDGNVVLALTKSNTVAMRLSDSLRQHVDAKIAKDFGKDSAESALGRWVQRTTATLVSKGMGMEFSVPVKDIEDARYEDGEIRFEYRKDRKLKFHSFKNDGRSPMTGFAPEDAERFVEAVRQAIHARKT